MDGCRGSLNYSTPRRIASRILSRLKRGKVKRVFVVGDSRKDDGDDDVAPPDVTVDAPNAPPERCKREANLNVGIGFCLLHLIAESKNELQKMTELRTQMETLLQNVKEELKNKDLPVVKKLESNEGVDESLGFESGLISNEVLLFDQSLKSEDDVPRDDEYLELEGMGRLEAELEAELERLQHHLDSGKLSTDPSQEPMEESISSSTASARSFSISYGEVIDPTNDGQEEDFADSYSGVPPFELARKLHELLETRQQERIRELEAALERAREELCEKEREISWWKDTAHLVSKHIKDPSRLNFQLAQHSRHSFLSLQPVFQAVNSRSDSINKYFK
ncbi:hypothetical protein CCACVL1_23409 [Corchorus capsularis]|uniref:Uncharacterized protein n=1 Tax=Corchorus capsularis TaxID=210143 RepID=A0A1R3GU43_COCAP|nr:hypothetical protein CCACVL1_23409 [Corchorus capsularis]